MTPPRIGRPSPDTTGDTLLVVGGGAAGHACVAAYRDAGGGAPVLLVSGDDRLPYFRPHVSKDYLAGDVERDALALVPEPWYAAHGVDVVLDCEVGALDLTTRTATSSVGPLRWGRCVLATGSDAGSLAIPGADHPDVLTVRAAADAERLLEATASSAPVAIVGSGFVGSEVAATLRRRGVEVAMVSDEPRPQQLRLGATVGHMIEGWLRDLGVTLTSGRPVSSITHGDGAVRIEIADAAPVDAALVVIAVGARPRLGLAAGAGLAAESSVPVSSTMQTAFGDVLAVGDVAEPWHEVAGRRIRVEHWGDAEAHGRVAGLTLAGHDASWRTVPGFWSTIGGETIKYVAWGDGHDEIGVRRADSGTSVWYARDGAVVGVLTHEDDATAETAAEAVAQRWPMPKGLAADG